MIHFFARQRDTLEKFVASWAGELRSRLRTYSYNRIPFLNSLPPGPCIFADFERLRRWKFLRASDFCAKLQAAIEPRIILNHPRNYLRRFELMRTLRARGINDFQVYRVNEIDGALRYPVFLRSEVDHRGAISGLLRSRDELNRALSRLSLRNFFRRKHLMVVEYSEGADGQGIFRKYAAMNVRGDIIPRHILFSRDWVTKKPDHVTDATVEEEIAFLKEFPHREQLKEIFRLAGVDYGRIDYGVINNRIQVWEINTNPVVVPQREKLDPKRLESQSRSAALIVEALKALI